VGKKIDYGRAGESPRPLGGIQYDPLPSPGFGDFGPKRRGLDHKIITISAGCAFLVGAFVSLVLCLQSLYGGVFDNLDPIKAAAGFGGGALCTFLCAWAAWRFLYKT
jgi:hypothetical protein